MKNTVLINLILAGLLVQPAFSQKAFAQEISRDVDFDAQHESCLEKITDNPETAFEDAMIWQSQGGGRRARHCVATALFALGHEGEAALRLEKIAKAPDGGTPTMRAGFYAEAAEMWLAVPDARRALAATSAGLKIARSNLDLRIYRAQAYGALGRWDYSETDLISALAFHPGDPRALRIRAETYLQQGNLQKAKADIEASIAADGTNIDTFLLRGKINEAMRLKGNPGDELILLPQEK